MGMYATVNGREIKYSGLVAIAGSKIANIDSGMVTFSRDQVVDLAVLIAEAISDLRVAAHEIHVLRSISMACDKLEAIVLWLDSDDSIGSSLTFA
jgi:hypothetical protein